jgi:hypothetical protein
MLSVIMVGQRIIDGFNEKRAVDQYLMIQELHDKLMGVHNHLSELHDKVDAIPK